MGSHKINKVIHSSGVFFQAVRSQMEVFSDYYLKTNYSKPFMVLIEPTLRCTMRCKFCNLFKDNTYPKKTELTLEQWKSIIRDIQCFLPLAKEIFISGGEPFLRSDICELLEYIHSIGIGTRIATIGAFCTEDICEKLLSSPPNWLKFSIHSADPNVHDELVGRNVFRKSQKAIFYLKENGYSGKIGFLTTVWKGNYKNLVDIVNLARDWGVDNVFFRPLFGTTIAIRKFTDPTKLSKDCLISDLVGLQEELTNIKNLRRLGYPITNNDRLLDLIYLQSASKNYGLKNCHMMYESIYIRPNGDVEICGHMSLGTLGNLSKESMIETLFSAESYSMRHNIDRDCTCQGNAFVRKTLSEKIKSLMDQISS